MLNSRHQTPACLLTAGSQDQHHYYRSDPHGAGPPELVADNCHKTPSPNINAAQGVTQASSADLTNGPSSKEERLGKHQRRSDCSPSSMSKLNARYHRHLNLDAFIKTRFSLNY